MLSKTSTLPYATSIFSFLLNSKLLAFILRPSVVMTVPPFLPKNLFPFSKISISVISKLNSLIVLA